MKYTNLNVIKFPKKRKSLINLSTCTSFLLGAILSTVILLGFLMWRT